MSMNSEAGTPAPAAWSRMLAFWKSQHLDWKVTVGRTSLERLSYQMIFPYLSIYIIALGATKTQLGLMNSLGMLLAGLVSPLTGRIIDHNGPKRLYLIGIGILAASYLLYGLSPGWLMCAAAMVVYNIGYGTSIHSCATICGNCLVNENRARGMMICETLAAGMLGMAGPMLAAWVVTGFGGVTVAGIRPLFLIAVLFTALSYVLVQTKLSDQKWSAAQKTSRHLLHDGFEIIRHNPHTVKWLVISTMTQLPIGMIMPFTQVFAKEFKGADGFVLGAMVTGTALTSIVFGFPSGAVADRIGRKKALYMLIPLFWASILVLVWAPSPAFLILSSILTGFQYILMPIAGTIERELVPAEQMGRWIGIVRLAKAVFGAGMTVMGGVIWDRLGPQWLFIIFVGLDLTVRLPLLISMPETLNYRVAKAKAD